MIITKQVKSDSGQVFWVEFESGYADGKGMWRVIDTEPQQFEVGDTIHPNDMGKFTTIDEESEEENSYSSINDVLMETVDLSSMNDVLDNIIGEVEKGDD